MKNLPVMKGFEKDYELYLEKIKLKNNKATRKKKKKLKQKRLIEKRLIEKELDKINQECIIFKDKLDKKGNLNGFTDEEISYFRNKLSLWRYVSYKSTVISLKTLKPIYDKSKI